MTDPPEITKDPEELASNPETIGKLKGFRIVMQSIAEQSAQLHDRKIMQQGAVAAARQVANGIEGLVARLKARVEKEEISVDVAKDHRDVLQGARAVAVMVQHEAEASIGKIDGEAAAYVAQLKRVQTLHQQAILEERRLSRMSEIVDADRQVARSDRPTPVERPPPAIQGEPTPAELPAELPAEPKRLAKALLDGDETAPPGGVLAEVVGAIAEKAAVLRAEKAMAIPMPHPPAPAPAPRPTPAPPVPPARIAKPATHKTVAKPPPKAPAARKRRR